MYRWRGWLTNCPHPPTEFPLFSKFLRPFLVHQQDADAGSWICPGHSAEFSSFVWGSKEREKLSLPFSLAIICGLQNKDQSNVSPSVLF